MVLINYWNNLPWEVWMLHRLVIREHEASASLQRLHYPKAQFEDRAEARYRMKLKSCSIHKISLAITITFIILKF